MGLASALSTALTGLTAAETTIDVVGNNLANSNTVGFKASEAEFATQFLQTQSLGSAPTGNSGGTNPRQVGLGAMVASITPNFTQGTIEVSASPTDMAIQGDGFFILEGSGGQVYSRNGIFETNSANELVSVTGNRLLGYGVDKNFEIDSSGLRPITIPLGTATVAKATQNVVLQGTLTPQGDIGTQAAISQTGVLGDAQYNNPTTAPTVVAGGAGNIPGGSNYRYYVTFVRSPAEGSLETRPNSPPGSVYSPASDAQYNITSLPTDSTGKAVAWRVYRNLSTSNENGPYYQVGNDIPIGSAPTALAPFVDNYDDSALLTKGVVLNLNGPPIQNGTKLTDVISRDTDGNYQQVFPDLGTLHFSGSKGGRTLATKDLTIGATSTVSDLMSFMQDSLGIQKRDITQPNPIPLDQPTGEDPSVTIKDSMIRIVGNNGVDNAISVGLSGIRMTTVGPPPEDVPVNLPFSSVQTAKGQSATTDFVAYDSLGMQLSVRVTAVLEERTSTYTAYRWYADCANNSPASGSAIAVGTGV